MRHVKHTKWYLPPQHMFLVQKSTFKESGHAVYQMKGKKARLSWMQKYKPLQKHLKGGISTILLLTGGSNKVMHSDICVLNGCKNKIFRNLSSCISNWRKLRVE